MDQTNARFLGASGATLLVVTGLLTGCGGIPSRVSGGAVEQTLNQKPTKGSYITAIGIGGSDPELPSDTQRKALARDAAIAKAQFEMLSMIKGVTLKGGVKVSRAIESGSVLEAQLHETIRGAEIVKSEFTSDHGCVVTLRLPKDRLEGLMRSRLE